jgi:hypothetical protein
MPYLPSEGIQVFALFVSLFSERVWRHAQVLLQRAMLTPRARMVPAALRVMSLAKDRHFTNDHLPTGRPGQPSRGVRSYWDC